MWVEDSTTAGHRRPANPTAAPRHMFGGGNFLGRATTRIRAVWAVDGSATRIAAAASTPTEDRLTVCGHTTDQIPESLLSLPAGRDRSRTVLATQ